MWHAAHTTESWHTYNAGGLYERAMTHPHIHTHKHTHTATRIMQVACECGCVAAVCGEGAARRALTARHHCAQVPRRPCWYACARVCTHACVRLCVCMCVRVCECVCVCKCVCVCECLCVCECVFVIFHCTISLCPSKHRIDTAGVYIMKTHEHTRIHMRARSCVCASVCL